MNISLNFSRLMIFLIWAAAFIIILTFIFIKYAVMKHIEWEDFEKTLLALSDLYAPYLGAITVFYLTQNNKNQSNHHSTAFIVGISVSLIWNLLLLVFGLLFLFEQIFLNNFLKGINILGHLSWILAGLMGYYYSKS